MLKKKVNSDELYIAIIDTKQAEHLIFIVIHQAERAPKVPSSISDMLFRSYLFIKNNRKLALLVTCDR